MATTSSNPSSKQSPPRQVPANAKKRPVPKRKRNPVWTRIKTFFTALTLLVLVALVVVIGAVFLRLYRAPRTIDLADNPLGITYLYSSDGTPLAEFFTERRKVITIDAMPKDLQNATIAFEDRRFYQNSGIDIKGIGRSLYSNFTHGDLHGEGGSTITQQLARNMGVGGLTRQKSYGRKFNELIIASQINNSYTKQQILEMYLNQVNYGSGAYGVEAAAEVYFNKHAKQLDLAQCALIAGLPNRPAEFNPYKSKEAAQGQRKRVLDQMLGQSYITPAQYSHAVAEPIKLAGAKAPPQGSQVFHAPYFVSYVVDQLRRKYGADRLYEGNLKVYTTLNWTMQQIAEQEVKQGIANAHEYGANQGALVCLDPKTGEVKAMVGGTDYKKSQVNYAVHGRQPGSSFKAVVYSAAINDGSVKESTPVLDVRTVFGKGAKPYIPKDDSGYSDRYMDLREATAYSVNVVAVKVLHLIGPQAAIRYARMMGIHSHLDPVLSLALGSSPVSPLEMASAYSTIADSGNHPEPSAWTRLDDAQDNVIEDVPPDIETHILQPDTVHQLDDMLRAVVTEGTGKMVAAQVPDARGKTGTTQEHKDVWFVGYTPQLVCAVWAGHPTDSTKNHGASYGEAMASNAFGGTVCAPIWAKFMSRSLPIFHQARVKELALEKSKQVPVAKPVTAADTATAISSSPADKETAPDSSPTDSSDTPTRPRRHKQAHDNGDGTVTVNVDDASGLLAPDGSPASHSETFTSGSEPTTLSPQYPTGSDAPTPDTPPSDRPTDHAAGHVDADAPSTDSSPVTDISTPTDSALAPRRRHHRDSADSGRTGHTDTLTVMVNPEDGLLATKWCPQQVSRTFPRGQEPHRHSRMYPPPPGER